MAKQDDYTKTALRLPRELHQKLMDAASTRGHSLNTEMVYRLDSSFSEMVEQSDQQLEMSVTLDALRGVIADIAIREDERDEAVRALGHDLNKLCDRALPTIADEERFRNLVRMLAEVGIALQAGDITDAQGRLRALYYLAIREALGSDTPERHALVHEIETPKKPRRKPGT